MDYTALKNEILTDPASLGYNQYVADGNDAAVAILLNASGPSTITESSISKDDFLLAIVPALITLAGLSAEIQGKWDRILAVVQASSSINLLSPQVQDLLQAAAADGVLTQDQAASIGKRLGSRAEVLFGAGIVVSQSDVSMALRGDQ